MSAKRTKTLHSLQKMKNNGEPITMLTCYDSSFAKIIARANIDTILVGDSLGNVMLGHQDTLAVTLDDMIHHCRAVTRIDTGCFIICDMPFGSYTASVEHAVNNAVRLVKEGKCHAVKLEGGKAISEMVNGISNTGIAVVGHLGFTPQSVNKIGGYRVQGRGSSADVLIEDAISLEESGADMIVLEMVPATVAAKIAKSVNVPVIGIGAGSDIDGQVLVLQDMLGFDSGFNPTFLKKYLNLEGEILDAMNRYSSDVKEKRFPAEGHSYIDK